MTSPTVTITTDDAWHLLELLERRILDVAEVIGERPHDWLTPGVVRLIGRGLDEDQAVYERVMDAVVAAEEEGVQS